MRSIAELHKVKRSTAELYSNVTDYSTTGLTDMQPTMWAKEVIHFGEALRILDQLVYVNKEMVGTKSEKVTIAASTSHKTITTSSTEGTARTTTEMDQFTTVSFTVASTDFLMGVIHISTPLMMTCSVDLLAQARYTIAQDLADDVDLALATALSTTGIDTTNGVVFGGDATSVTEIAAGDVITTDLIADAIRIIESSNFVAKYLVINPYQKATMLKDSQFVNASEYGSNEIVLKGEIGSYLGLKVIVTTNENLNYAATETETNEAASAAVAMNVCPVIGERKNGEKVSVGLAWKMMPKIDYEYHKDEAVHALYYDQAFTTSTIFTEAIALIKVSTI